MSSFAPLNVILEEESEEEIDDSKELQIEEALKLYQNALKLHSQGPEFYSAAEAAYKELFRSEIFTYTESLSEARWIELYGDVDVDEDGGEDDLILDLTSGANASGDGAPNTLPQILYLAFKNHGQFRLDRLKDQLSQIERNVLSADSALSAKDMSDAASDSLKNLVEALERDETDIEVWRKVSRVSEFLGSRRIARFCLEAVLDTDESGLTLQSEPMGLDEIFAAEQLRPLLASIDDQISWPQFQRPSGGQRKLLNAFRKQIDPCPYLPKSTPSLLASISRLHAREQEIKVPMKNWTSCGKAILFRLSQESQGLISSDSGASYFLTFSRKPSEVAPSAARTIKTNSGPTLDYQSSAVEEDLGSEDTPAVQQDLPVDAVKNMGDANPALASPTDISSPVVERSVYTQHAGPEYKSLEHDEAQQPENLIKQVNTGQVVSPRNETIALPTRKRSSEAADLPETTEIGRSRSKRIKARGSLADPNVLIDTTAEDWTKWYEQQLQIYVEADQLAFKATDDFLARSGCENFSLRRGSDDVLPEQLVSNEGDETSVQLRCKNAATQDLKSLLDEWDFVKSKSFLHGDGSQRQAANPGFSAFLEQSTKSTRDAAQRPVLPEDHGLDSFLDHVCQQAWISLKQIAFQWTQELLWHRPMSRKNEQSMSLYEAFLWPDALKDSLVQILVTQDEFIFSEVSRKLDNVEHLVLAQSTEAPELISEYEEPKHFSASNQEWVAFVQILFELHLDIYGRITNPSSEVDNATRVLQRDRLSRWAVLASRFISEPCYPPDLSEQEVNALRHLSFRFLWSSVVCNNLLDPSSSEHTNICFRDIIRLLKEHASTSGSEPLTIYLPNNAVMSEISIDAAEKEISRLTTMDFFTGIFSSEDDDPLAIIENLEPLLDLSIKKQAERKSHTNTESNTREIVGQSTTETSIAADPRLVEALQFLDRASLSLQLFLWQRLQDAYSVINYPPQILACNLRSFGLIVKYLGSSSYLEVVTDNRHVSLLLWLHRLDGLMTQILALASVNATAFDCVDNELVRSSMEAVAALQRIVHVFTKWEDSIRVGQIQPAAQLSNAASKAHLKSADKFREMVVKTWTLQYTLIKEAISQNQEQFLEADQNLIHYLRLIHNALGLRTYCALANKVFLRLAKTELLRMKPSEGWETDLPQIIFDLYGLKISTNPSEIQDHACESSDIDKVTALEVLDIVMLHVNRINIKELLKNDLRFAIDKMQQVIKVPRASSSSAGRTFNKRLINNYLKTPINPIDLYRSRQGIGGLCSTAARTEGWVIADKGWYFMLGNIALAKFRSQKRTAPGSTDDLEIAKNFFKQDLEFDTEKWETWYRLAQVYDTTIDEYTTWTADKLDNDMNGLAELQRKAILCYTMAVAVATRYAEPSFENTSKIADLHADFGTRVYASTREPFSMKAFSLDDFKKYYNGVMRGGMYEGLPFRGLHLYPAWKFASVLLRQAANQKPTVWATSYLLGKVLWKMHNCDDDVRGSVQRIGYQPAIDAFVRAIECVPEKRDSRHPEKDPILEPHYKLVSVVHKLVRSQRLSTEEGCRILKATPYARKIPDIQASDEWKQYLMKVLGALRSADKANWHHRMVARTAHIIYEDNPNELSAALEARHELTQQIFTKTMSIQVWKPDNERAGRHFVYTGRYVSFFVRLLYQIDDKDSLEALARRIRKRAGEFVDHARIWHEVSFAYLKLLRNRVPVAYQYEESIFRSCNPEEFFVNASRLESWILMPTTNCPKLDILREAIEFKKLNNTLLKPVIIEDLIADVYAHIYEANVPEIKAKEIAEECRVRMRVDNILTNPTPTPSGFDSAPPGPLSMQGSEQSTIVKRKPSSITRREIIRRAEALITKPAPISTPRAPPRAIAPAPESGKAQVLAVVINQDATRGAVSVPGSVHDSADDESELSDREEATDIPHQDEEHKTKQQGRAPLFPNLLNVQPAAGENGESGQVSEQDEENYVGSDTMEGQETGRFAEDETMSRGDVEEEREGDAMES